MLDHFKHYSLGEISISSVVAIELACGVVKSDSEHNRNALEMFLAAFEILPVSKNMIWHYGEIRTLLENKGSIIAVIKTNSQV